MSEVSPSDTFAECGASEMATTEICNPVVWDIQPLELLTEEQQNDYDDRASWTWVEAIYLLQGYKPVFQISTEQVRSHFPDMVQIVTDSMELGLIGKKVNRAGQTDFIDTPANWIAFLQTRSTSPSNE